jgi:hypothetical protein
MIASPALKIAKASSVHSTGPSSPVAMATAESATARSAASETIAFACQPTRSSAVGITSRIEANTHTSTNAGTTAPLASRIASILPGRNGFHIDSAHAETMPAPTRNTIVWLM